MLLCPDTASKKSSTVCWIGHPRIRTGLYDSSVSSRNGARAMTLLTLAVRAQDEFAVMSHMTKMLDEAIAKIRELPEDEQDEAAAILLSVASRNTEVVELDDETRAAVREGLEQARQGKFVSDKEMAAFFRRHGVKRHGA